MFNILRKTSLALLVASTAVFQMSCNNGDADPDKLGNWYRDGIPSYGGAARSSAVSFLIGDKGYIGTGITNQTTPRVKDIWSYDAGDKIWSQIADFPGSGRNNAVAFVVGEKAYVGTGYDGVTAAADGGYKQDFYVYDGATNKWDSIADFKGGTRQYATAFTVGNKGYVGLGNNNIGYFQDFYEYDPTTDKWTEIATFTGGKRLGSLAFTIDGIAYVGFGRSNSGTTTKDLYKFDPAGNSGKGSWTKTVHDDDDSFPARTNGLALVINNKAYIIGGDNLSSVWEYVPGTNIWTEVASLIQAKGYAGGFAVGGLGYLGTGGPSTSTYLDDFWAFDPTAAINDDDN